MANPNISEILTTTIANYSGEIADNVTKNNAILRQLSKRGNIKTFDGGTEIYQELQYAENGTATWYSGFDTVSITPQDVLTTANYTIKQCAVAVTVSGLQMAQNMGKERIHDFVKAKVKNAQSTLSNLVAEGMYSDGTGFGGKTLGGLQLLVADTPTNTVGGINRANYTFWKNYSFDATTDGGAAASATNIESYMNTVYLNVSRGTDKPDIILADNNYYNFFQASLQAIQRISDADTANAGFMNLLYHGTPVIFDGGKGGFCPTNHMYFLNTDYLFFRPHSQFNFVELGPDERYSTNQDAMTKLMGFYGNMTMSNGSLQAVLKD
jgi:hypothetical protein